MGSTIRQYSRVGDGLFWPIFIPFSEESKDMNQHCCGAGNYFWGKLILVFNTPLSLSRLLLVVDNNKVMESSSKMTTMKFRPCFAKVKIEASRVKNVKKLNYFYRMASISSETSMVSETIHWREFIKAQYPINLSHIDVRLSKGQR